MNVLFILFLNLMLLLPKTAQHTLWCVEKVFPNENIFALNVLKLKHFRLISVLWHCLFYHAFQDTQTFLAYTIHNRCIPYFKTKIICQNLVKSPRKPKTIFFILAKYNKPFHYTQKRKSGQLPLDCKCTNWRALEFHLGVSFITLRLSSFTTPHFEACYFFNISFSAPVSPPHSPVRLCPPLITAHFSLFIRPNR